MTSVLKPTDPRQARRRRPRHRRSQAQGRSGARSGPAPSTAESGVTVATAAQLSDPRPFTVVPSDRHLHAVPPAAAIPAAARVLAMLQVGSSWVAGLLVIAVIGSYSYSVHVDRQLQRTNSRLHSLKRSEQQLTTVNEVLKNHIAQQTTIPSANFQPPRPGNVIFLQPTPSRPVAPVPAAIAPLTLPKPTTPLGY